MRGASKEMDVLHVLLIIALIAILGCPFYLSHRQRARRRKEVHRIAVTSGLSHAYVESILDALSSH